VIAAVGTGDNNTWPRLSENYVAALKKRELPAELVAIDGGSHSMNAGMRAAVLKLFADGKLD
jgi:dipeptidyl aminopeptidase/acylaminoacyl peptidase